MTPPGNVSASVRQRLLNRARSDGRLFDEMLRYFAMERFLYRLSRSAHAEQFVLKGALMLRVWRAAEFRPTMDIDLLGRASNEEAEILAQVRDVLHTDVETDGLAFDPDSIRTERVTEDADYGGIRVRFSGALDSARIRMQIDIGFGDVVYPGPEVSDLPVMLDLPAPRLLCYSRESSIAEKFEAMVKLGMLNSRMKDFYDIWLLSRRFDFTGIELARAIRLTFERRGTELPLEIEAFTQSFIDAKQTQWAAFRNRIQQSHIPASYAEITTSLEQFLLPVVSALSSEKPFPANWAAPGPWR